MFEQLRINALLALVDGRHVHWLRDRFFCSGLNVSYRPRAVTRRPTSQSPYSEGALSLRLSSGFRIVDQLGESRIALRNGSQTGSMRNSAGDTSAIRTLPPSM